MKTFHINGVEIQGEVVDFNMVQEPFSVYQLTDGTFIKGKTVILKIIKTDQKNPIDTPSYVFVSQFVATPEERE
jgi:hypothetical protein